VRIAVADSCPAMRLGITAILSQNNIEIVGETGDGEELLLLVQERRPDLVVLSINLAGKLNGVEVCRRIKVLPNAPYVLVHTAYNFAEAISSCAQAGADSCLHAHTDPEEFLDALHRTAAGEPVWEVGRHIKEERSAGDPISAEGDQLTPREIEVLGLKLRRHLNAEIAEELGISVHTVKHHVTRIHKKLAVTKLKRFL
jgi:two-component system response regulator DevR